MNCGATRRFEACSNAYASFSNSGSAYAVPTKEKPTGTPNTIPIGLLHRSDQRGLPDGAFFFGAGGHGGFSAYTGCGGGGLWCTGSLLPCMGGISGGGVVV